MTRFTTPTSLISACLLAFCTTGCIVEGVEEGGVVTGDEDVVEVVELEFEDHTVGDRVEGHDSDEADEGYWSSDHMERRRPSDQLDPEMEPDPEPWNPDGRED